MGLSWSPLPGPDICPHPQPAPLRRRILSTQLPHIEISCDGSGTKSTGLAAASAGWGFVAAVFEGNTYSHTLAEGSGPVILDEDDIRFLGATRLTNNTGEISSFAESLIWAMTTITRTQDYSKIIIRPDSLIALRAALGVTRGGVNREASEFLHTLWKEFKQRWGLKGRYAKVKGHSKDRFNDIADRLADEGNNGVIGNQGGRWDPVHHSPSNPHSDHPRWVAQATRSISISHDQGTMFVDTSLRWHRKLVWVREGGWLPYAHVSDPPTFCQLRETLSTSMARALRGEEGTLFTPVEVPFLLLMNPTLPEYEASQQADDLIEQSN